MLGGRADNSTLQPERFHGFGIAVLIFMQFSTTHHIVRRLTGPDFVSYFFFAPSRFLRIRSPVTMGTTVACRCGSSRPCAARRTRLSSPKVSFSHLRLASIQLSSLPSLAISSSAHAFRSALHVLPLSGSC